MTSESELEIRQVASPFARVLVGVDGGEPCFDACRQAVRLAEPGTPIELVAVVHLAEAARAGSSSVHAADRMQQDADDALARAAELVGERARPRFVDGYITASLIREIVRTNATLIAIGTHGHRRLVEIFIGGVVGELLHTAPCSVLVARPTADPSRFPQSIVVGDDGSPGAGVALSAAEELAARLSVPIRVVVATHGGDVDLDRVRRRWPAAEEVAAAPVSALVAASHDSELLVVGSRGLTGLRALGSVSERVAHQAGCSVLVARPGG